MEKKHVIFALKLFIAGVLLGILAGFLGLNPLGISQEQVIIALESLFLVLGLITTILTFYFIRKSHKAYKNYQREEEDEENEQDYLAMYRFLDYGTVAWNVCQISMLACLLLDLGGLGPSAASLLLIVVGIWSVLTASKSLARSVTTNCLLWQPLRKFWNTSILMMREKNRLRWKKLT